MSHLESRVLFRSAIQFISAVAATACLLGVAASATAGLADPAFSPPDEFLASKQPDAVLIVSVDNVEDKWVTIEGDSVPFCQVACSILEQVQGRRIADTTMTVAQVTYTDMIAEPIAPPAMPGKQYLALLKYDDAASFGLKWMFDPQGLLRVRGEGANRYVYWDRKTYSLGSIHWFLQRPAPPLTDIKDARQRIMIAQNRIESGKVEETSSIIQALIPNIQNPEEQARTVSLAKKPGREQFTDFTYTGEADPHHLWYESLCTLKSLAGVNGGRLTALAALRPFASDKREHVALVASLILGELGDDAGSATLARVLNKPARTVSQDPSSATTFFGQFRFEDSSVNASAFVLGLLGDTSLLKSPKTEIRLCAADGLLSQTKVSCLGEVEAVLRQIAKEQDAQIEKLRTSGKLSEKRKAQDQRSRYPREWVKVHAMLASLGDAKSLKMLAEAWANDQKTYSKDDSPAAAFTCRMVEFDAPTKGWPSLIDGIYQGGSGSTTETLRRLREAVGSSDKWKDPDIQRLRSALGDPSTSRTATEAMTEESDARKRIEEYIASSDPGKRAQALAAAGHYKIDKYYDKVLTTALHGKGEEAMAATYALGLYERPVSDADVRMLMKSKDVANRFTALEFATRHDPVRFAAEALEVSQALLADNKNDSAEMIVDALPRILCRFMRTSMPEAFAKALSTSSTQLKVLIIQAAGLSGNPATIASIQPLLSSSDRAVRTAAQQALDFIGPAD